MKICTCCKKELDVSKFYKHSSRKDGLSSECRLCASSKRKTPEFRERRRKYQNGDKYSAWRREHIREKYWSNPKYRAKNNAHAKLRYRLEQISRPPRKLLTREEKLERRRVWRNTNRERLNEKERNRRNRKREDYLVQKRVQQMRRKSLANGLTTAFTVADWKSVVEKFSGACAYCGNKAKLQQDHFVPMRLGGGYTKDNIVPACQSCNGRKNDKEPLTYLFGFGTERGAKMYAEIMAVLS